MKRLIFSLLFLLSAVSWAEQKTQPNILWLTSEDNSADYLGCYGNSHARTPHLDALAKRGFRYTQCYSNGAVCSATRSSWIMGMISTATGAHHHRSAVTIPESLVMYPQALAKAGYYTVNGYKCDYNVQYDQDLWEGGSKLDWQTLQKKQPFFQVINFNESHEQRLMTLEHKHSTEDIQTTPYFPTTDISKQNIAVYYDAITKMDTKIGEALAQLKQAGLAENTIVIYCSDHGGALPRGKRFLYNSGIHCPLIVYVPEALKHLYPAEAPGTTVDRLVSFIDMPITWLSLTGAEIPENYHGTIFLGEHTQPEPKYHYAFRGRNGERVENVRAIRDTQYLLIKNYFPYVPRGQRQDYQWGIPMQQDWENEFHLGKLNTTQARYFQPRGSYELYDTTADPHCIENRINDPELQTKVQELKAALLQQQADIRDCALIPESMLIRLSEAAGVTQYEFLQSEANYPIQSLQALSDIALSNDPKQAATLASALTHKHPAMRYWAAQGLMNLGMAAKPQLPALTAALQDKDDTVAISAAISVLRLGEKQQAYQAMRQILKRPASTKIDVLNQIAWLENLNRPLLAEVAALENLEGTDYQMQQFLLTGKGTRKPAKPKKAKKANKPKKANKSL